MIDDSDPGAHAARADLVLEPGHEHAAPDMFPRLTNMSAAFMYRAVIRARDPQPPEYVTVPLLHGGRADLVLHGAVAQWNQLWEGAQFRRRMFGEEDLPAPLYQIADRGDINVVFLPRTPSRYYEHAPLFHLLPTATLQRFGLPLLRAGQWPFLADWGGVDRFLPSNFERRMERAWASAVWRHLMPGSRMSGFSGSDPIRLLAHNLDFWIPPVTAAIQDVLRELPLVDKGVVEETITLQDGSVLAGALIGNPRMGSDVWRGEQEAAEIVGRVVETADSDGRLRGILDAVRVNRVEEDFSDRWSYVREDFDRKLYHKRNKVKIRFVELTDTIPVQGPESQIVDRVVLGDLLALLDVKDRQIVILMHSGVTKLTEIAGLLGYSNHSAISKRLNRIRTQAAQVFGID